jgi:hypothetical protein
MMHDALLKMPELPVKKTIFFAKSVDARAQVALW